MLWHDNRCMELKPGSISPQAASQNLIATITREWSSQPSSKSDENRPVCFLVMRKASAIFVLIGKHSVAEFLCGADIPVREIIVLFARFDDRGWRGQETSGV